MHNTCTKSCHSKGRVKTEKYFSFKKYEVLLILTKVELQIHASSPELVLCYENLKRLRLPFTTFCHAKATIDASQVQENLRRVKHFFGISIFAELTFPPTI